MSARTAANLHACNFNSDNFSSMGRTCACRSAFAEHALRDRLGALAPGRTETASVGTRPNLELRVPPALVAEAEAV